MKIPMGKDLDFTRKSCVEYIDMGILESWTTDFECGPGPYRSLITSNLIRFSMKIVESYSPGCGMESALYTYLINYKG